MISRMIRLLSLSIALFIAIPALAFADPAGNVQGLDKSKLEEGVIGVNYEVKSDVLTRVKVAKGSASYIYTLDASANQQTVWLPLQMGDGSYEISILENVSGNKYKVALTEKADISVADTANVFLHPVQNVNWTNAVKATTKAKELTSGQKTDEQKAVAIYDYIVNNIRYDKELAKKVTSDYIPDIDNTFVTGKGICYGYATLYAAMLRSEGIPTKLVMGTTKLLDEYHAWNEVFLNGKWVVVDTTIDAGLIKSSKKGTFQKKASDYQPQKVY
ncbi:transglutaminase-like domain-containing protein [Cohnella terricola]|uniref:Transglutaminase domain-containing protein n=1 Tax=Cohnella terricola TaxID=1289167 RepID=A0A559JXE3_9BACL|nr:transglutaminase-like domain-containing protein [Cohnella terricola]TVY04507.1 transglutaminase domain-containing protein [Cohnella terricola]